MTYLKQAQSMFKGINWTQEDQVSFSLDSDHFLFLEHFPGFPVAPASLIMEFIKLCIAKQYAQEGFKFSISNAKFLNPMMPEQTYICRFRVRSKNTLFFSISDTTGKEYNKGIVSFISKSEVKKNAA